MNNLWYSMADPDVQDMLWDDMYGDVQAKDDADKLSFEEDDEHAY